MKPTLTLACVAVLAVTACSKGAEPTGSFKQDGTRVFESYRQSKDVTKKVTIPPGTKTLRLKMDCINESGFIKVEAGTAFGDLACGEESAPTGSIGIEASRENQFDSIKTIAVTAPAGAAWSVAVDALDTPIPPS